MREEVEIDAVCGEGHELSFMAWRNRRHPGNGLVPHLYEDSYIEDTLLPGLFHIDPPALPLAGQMRQGQREPVIFVENYFLDVLVSFSELL